MSNWRLWQLDASSQRRPWRLRSFYIWNGRFFCVAEMLYSWTANGSESPHLSTGFFFLLSSHLMRCDAPGVSSHHSQSAACWEWQSFVIFLPLKVLDESQRMAACLPPPPPPVAAGRRAALGTLLDLQLDANWKVLAGATRDLQPINRRWLIRLVTSHDPGAPAGASPDSKRSRIAQYAIRDLNFSTFFSFSFSLMSEIQ